MRNLRHILSFLMLISIVSCEDPVEPIDIFKTEELTSPEEIELGTDKGMDILYVNSDRIIETPEGFRIKGTIFSKALKDIIPVTSGDFTINMNAPLPSLKKGLTGGIEFKGYGTASLPSVGIFSASEIGEIPGSEVWYNTGRSFKKEATGHLPLLDDKYYFRHRLENGKGKEYRMKKIILNLREYYIDASDPAAVFTGDIYSENAGVKKLVIKQAAVGISANELWDFVPYDYGNNLEAVSGGTGFESMNGGISLSGIIPIKKYPVAIFGEAVINSSFSSKGPLDFFERGFDDASFRIGVNGQLFFTHELVSFLTGVDTVKLGRSTLQAEFTDENFSMRMAGEYSDNVLERLLGEKMMSFIPYHSREGIIYLRATNDPDDLVVYMEEKISMQIPGLGTVPISGSIFRITKDEVSLTGTINLPYNIGNVNITGVINRDGTFLLNGNAACTVDLGSGLNYNADLRVEITQAGVSLRGTMTLPYGIGNVEVAGGIRSDELFFGGKVSSSVPFPVDASVNCDLDVTISSKTGVGLSGNLGLPGGIGAVNVSGKLNVNELLLTGAISSGTGINFGNVDISASSALALTASSQSGIAMTGTVALPFSFGNASVTARVTSFGLLMTGSLGSHISIPGYPLFSADMSITASTASGLYLSGEMKFPGNFGWVGVSGYVRNAGYNLTGDISSASIDFGIVSLSTSFSMSISDRSGIKTSAEGEGCINVVLDKVCANVDVDVDIDYYNNSVRLCMDFPVVGDACVGW